LTGASYKLVSGWRAAGSFPSRYFLVMIFVLHEKGMIAPPELWGMVTPAERRRAVEAAVETARGQAA
jgi:hypothetical protein